MKNTCITASKQLNKNAKSCRMDDEEREGNDKGFPSEEVRRDEVEGMKSKG